jgi:Delta3-Delta2-enoyl-CoA isomerase
MIVTTEHGAVRELRLNRPPVNALSTELIGALARAVDSAPEDGVRALVLSGAPGRFSAGLDVPLLLTLDRPAMANLWQGLYALLRVLACSPIPIAAAITGHAPAGGTVLPLFCDRRVMAQGDWKIGVNEVQVGIPLPPVIISALKRQVGARHAETLGVSGILISPAEALRIGLVDEVTEPEDVVTRAVEWCNNLLALPPHAMSATREESRADLVALFERVEAETEEMIQSWWSEETQNTLHAVAERLGKKKAGAN